MSCRSLRLQTLFAAGLLAAACQEGPPTESVSADLELQAAIAEAGLAATVSGDAERAEALNRGADALRWGVRPSRIEVKVNNESYTYLAIVVGVVRQRDDGSRVLIRSLVAWTGRPPTALLQVTSKSDEAVFGSPDASGSGAGAARGVWKDLVNQEIWVATAGSADMELADLGNACPGQPHDPALRCVLASYNVGISGAFRQLFHVGPDGPAIEIVTQAERVHGIVIKPAD